MRSYQKTAIKITISIVGVLLIVVLFRDRFGEVIDIIKNSNKRYLALGLSIYILSNIFVALRLRSVLTMNSISFSLLRTWKLNYLGYFFNVFMPSSIGGDLAKGYYAYQYSGHKLESFMSVLIDRLIGLFSVFFLCALSIVFVHERLDDPLIPVIVFSVIFFLVIAVVFLSNKRFAQFLSDASIPFIPPKITRLCKKAYVVLHACCVKKPLALQAFVISLIFQCASMFGIFVLGLSIGIEIGFFSYLLLLPMVYVFSMLPSINGLGVREGAMIYFFSMFTTVEKAVALSFLFDVCLYACSLIGLICYLFHSHAKKSVIKDSVVSLDEMILAQDKKGE
jgi:glycosyltransferase 2 family protein